MLFVVCFFSVCFFVLFCFFCFLSLQLRNTFESYWAETRKTGFLASRPTYQPYIYLWSLMVHIPDYHSYYVVSVVKMGVGGQHLTHTLHR